MKNEPEIRFSVEGWLLKEHNRTFRRKDVATFGLKTPQRASVYTLRKFRNRFPMSCRDCDKPFDTGDLHASEIYGHYCLACVVPEEWVRDPYWAPQVQSLCQRYMFGGDHA